jgi:hypothetical protein
MSTPTPIARQQRIQSAHVCPTGLAVPPGHVGLLTLPGSGRTVWWTGRVAIGLRHEASAGTRRAVSSSALWIQSLLLGHQGRAAQAG